MSIHVDNNMSFALAWRKKFNLSLLSSCLKYQSPICPLCLSVHDSLSPLSLCLLCLSVSFVSLSPLSLEYLAENDVDEGLYEDLCIEPPRAVLKIVEVQVQPLEHLLHRIGITVI